MFKVSAKKNKIPISATIKMDTFEKTFEHENFITRKWRQRTYFGLEDS